MLRPRDIYWIRASRRILRLSDIAIFLTLWFFAIFRAERNVVWFAGSLVGIIGFSLWMAARIQLGRSFSIRAKATELVTTGLYRRFRHPIYLFGALAHFGALLTLQNWWVLGAWLLYVIPIQWSRLRKEEALLERMFGDAFRQHRKVTWI